MNHAFAKNDIEIIDLYIRYVRIVDNYCSSLAQISIPSSVTKIENFVFNKCSSLTKILIPSSITSIGCRAFGYCPSLAQISIFQDLNEI